MIIDSHCHIFEKWTGACGLASTELHHKYIQKTVTSSAAKSFRLRDGAEVDPSIYYRPGGRSWSDMREDINFSVGPNGRVEFIIDGEIHYVQYMPVDMAEIECPPQLIRSQMNVAHIDHAILHAGFSYGYMNDYNALAQHQFPEKFTGLFHVDEARADTTYWMAEARRAINQLELKGLYYHVDQFSRYNCDVWLDDPQFDEFWGLIEENGIHVFIEMAGVPDYKPTSLVANMGRLAKLMARFPVIRWVMVMSPPIQVFAPNGEWDFPEEALAVYKSENVMIEICYPISWGGKWDFPYPKAHPLIRDLRSMFGSEKLVWGSDMPNVGRFCTYKQSLEYIQNYCDFFTSKEMDKVLGGNIAELFGIRGESK